MSDPIAQLRQIIADNIQNEPEASQAKLAACVMEFIATNSDFLSALETSPPMLQNNQNSATGFQNLVQGGVANIGSHYHLSSSEKLDAVLDTVLNTLKLSDYK